MIRLIAVLGFVFAIASTPQAMPRSPIQSESMITPVVAGCGVGQTMVNGKCESRVEKRHNRRCLRWSGNTCQKYQ
ncbi:MULTISPECIES: hypothetical protein [unclassified Rhizobium]|uniref:hypothetical protein n=1 Tax=unclassified Rhizobium TaxID=2613769 RepID=UPI00146C3853|nr:MULTISPECIES: hypothetical protein [unclassified Rhizobium]MBD9446607.1 hypothetical protein [Rhizobium sp. RHZ01]MBD9453601.1 hypothetical protein [Rhizobium sp. RHZ02]NMN71414.1 hypothetical protein [Rhizobium sp. 57MFTsu3.2]